MPLISRSSYTQLPEWIRNYAQEAAIAARNLGVEVQPPPLGSPEGTEPTILPKPYVRYGGERFAPVNAMESSAERILSEDNPMNASLERVNRLIASSATPGTGENLDPYSDAFNDIVSNKVTNRGASGISGLLSSVGGQFARPGMRNPLFDQLGREETQNSQSDMDYLASQLAVKGHDSAAQGFNRDKARLLELAQGETDRSNLLNTARQQDVYGLLQSGAYLRTLEERPMQAEEEEFRRRQRHPYESLNFLIGALGGTPVETQTNRQESRPDPQSVARSMHSADWAGVAAQAAPGVLGALQNVNRQQNDARMEQEARQNAQRSNAPQGMIAHPNIPGAFISLSNPSPNVAFLPGLGWQNERYIENTLRTREYEQAHQNAIRSVPVEELEGLLRAERSARSANSPETDVNNYDALRRRMASQYPGFDPSAVIREARHREDQIRLQQQAEQRRQQQGQG